jgi:hypothetical protein
MPINATFKSDICSCFAYNDTLHLAGAYIKRIGNLVMSD